MPKNNLETQIKELESIVEKMESEQIDLEKSLKLFERGMMLVKNCQKSLMTAEQKVKQLTDDKLKNFAEEN